MDFPEEKYEERDAIMTEAAIGCGFSSTDCLTV
jgi:hypothetical protein